MANLLDQTDDSELMPLDVQTVHAWSQRYLQLMGDMPKEEEEPTDAQMAALDKRVNQMGQAPYVDMGVWLPFGRRAFKESVQGGCNQFGHLFIGLPHDLREGDREADSAVA